MLIELGIATFAMLAVSIAVVIFFCGVEMAPGIARKTALTARFAGLETDIKLVRS